MILPNAIIAGAPKCGTTSLFEYLAAHPEVCPSSIKETYYLIDEDYPLYRNDYNFKHDGFAGYNKFFRHYMPDQHRIVLEATPDYFYQNTPLEVLPSFDPVPNIIILLRKPSERVYSLFRFAQNNLAIIDRGVTFGDFLNMLQRSDKSLDGRLILQNAIEHSKYSNYLKKWYNTLGREHVHVFLFEDMVKNSSIFMKNLAAILGIDEKIYEGKSFTQKNKSVAIRSQKLQRLKRKYAKFLPSGIFKLYAHEVYNWIGIRKEDKIKTPEERKNLNKLDQLFSPYNEELNKLIAADLSCWA